VAVAKRTYVVKAAAARAYEMRYIHASGADTTKHGLQRAQHVRNPSYFLLPAVAAPGFGLAAALDSGPAGFFLSALGFLGSRLLLF
jgi:hypothetical protein